jgi:hypothetical protein
MTARENADWFNETPESLAMLAEERVLLAASEMRYAVAEALREIIDEWAAGMLDCEDLADAAIAAHLDALKADGYALVKLPDPTVTEAFGSQCLQWLDGEVTFFPAEERLEFDYRSIAPETARAVAAALIAGAAEAQR